MEAYRTQIKKIAGNDYFEIYDSAFKIYQRIKKRTKRKPYIRSKYFKNNKIFLDYFWSHLHQKNWRDRRRRLRFYPCALDLLKNNQIAPVSKQNSENSSEILHRFIGQTKDNETFYVQVKENINTDKKFLISIFADK